MKSVQREVPSMFQVVDILSVPLFAHTRHFFVYLGDGEIIEWGPWDNISWQGGMGSASKNRLSRLEGTYKYISSQGVLQDITLERRTGASKTEIEERVAQMTKGIDYHLMHRNCEHFACYVTGVPVRSEQSIAHLFTEQEPFSYKPIIHTLDQLRDALLKCRFCGPSPLAMSEFEDAHWIATLDDGFSVYFYEHPLGGLHMYVTPVAKTEDVISSYASITLAYHGALLGRGKMLAIVQQ